MTQFPNNAGSTLEHQPMSALQIVVVAIAVALNALDGFDLLSISFAAPGIAAEWGIDRGALGIVLSMELIGMGIGAFILGAVGDRRGRRPTVLVCLGLMLAGMLGVAYATGITQLCAYRIVTGIGLGGMLAVNNAIVAEFSSLRRRRLCVSLMVMGFTVGGVIGGYVATRLLAQYDWTSVFYFGAAATATFIPLVLLLVPESVPWLLRTQPADALVRINRTLKRLRHPFIEQLPASNTQRENIAITELFSGGILPVTLLVTAVYFFHAITFYFVLKWAPNIVVGLGYPPATAGTVLVYANVGGTIGGAVFGVLTQRFDFKKLFLVALAGSGITVMCFGYFASTITYLSFNAALNGFFCVSGLAAGYAAMAQLYPTHLRSSGSGFTVAVGRGGAILSPLLAGLLFNMDWQLPAVALAMSAGSLLAVIFLLPLDLGQRAPGQVAS